MVFEDGSGDPLKLHQACYKGVCQDDPEIEKKNTEDRHFVR